MQQNLENNVIEEAPSASPPPSQDAIPLENSWRLSFDRYIGPGFTAEEYADAITDICTVDSIQSYWAWFNNLPTAGELDASCTYHLMKSGIRPLWEDKANEDGGSMTFKIPLQEANSAWRLLSLGAIGGILDALLSSHDDRLNGVSIGMRKADASICVWNANASSFSMERMTQHVAEILRGTESSGSWAETLYQEAIMQTASYKVHRKLTNFGNDIKLPLLKGGSPQKGKNTNQLNKQQRKKQNKMENAQKISRTPKKKRSAPRSNRT
jgi:translation initiation factor 4E